MSSFKLLTKGSLRKDKPDFIGKMEQPSARGRKSDLSNHDHCGTCPTKMVGPAENEPKWTPELCKHTKYDERYTDIYCSIYVNKK